MKGDPIGFSGKFWLQHAGEINPFIELLKSEGIKSYLEIGCFMGDTFHAVGSSMPTGSRVVGVEFAKRMIGCPREASEIKASMARARNDLKKQGKEAQVFFGSSRNEKIIEKVRELGPFDAVLVDGDHSLKGVTADWKNYGPMARIVAFHDIVGDNPSSVGPRPLWAQLKKTHRHREFIATGTERGIGVLWRD